MVSTDLPRRRLVRVALSAKASSPMLVTESGTSTLVRWLRMNA
jgi:hypothetical protein